MFLPNSTVPIPRLPRFWIRIEINLPMLSHLPLFTRNSKIRAQHLFIQNFKGACTRAGELLANMDTSISFKGVSHLPCALISSWWMSITTSFDMNKVNSKFSYFFYNVMLGSHLYCKILRTISALCIHLCTCKNIAILALGYHLQSIRCSKIIFLSYSLRHHGTHC